MGQKLQKKRSVFFRLCQGCGTNDDILKAALGADLPGRAVMLQASGSFFAYEPILKALQSSQNMPLTHFIATPRFDSKAPETNTRQLAGLGGSSLLKGLIEQSSRLFPGKDPAGVLLHSGCTLCQSLCAWQGKSRCVTSSTLEPNPPQPECLAKFQHTFSELASSDLLL